MLLTRRLVELFFVLPLVRERLDDLQIPDHLVDEARLLGARRRLLLEHGVGVRSDELGDEEGERRHTEHDERDFPAQYE